MNRYLNLCRPGHVQQFLWSWTDLYVRPDSYPLALDDAQDHADAFMRAAKIDGISQLQIQQAIHGSDLRDIMVVRMRDSVEDMLQMRSTRPPAIPRA